MPVDDLLEHAKSGTDFYALLGEGIHAGSSEKDISRAYRRTALKHHPDKNKDDPNAVTKFHALQVAYDVLSDPAARAAYDAAREARERKKAQAERLDGRRRAFADELLRAEREGVKRKRDDADDEETALEREIKRLAEDGRRRRQERADALKREAEAERIEEEKLQEQGPKAATPTGGASISPISRTVKIQFQREGMEIKLDEDAIQSLFEVFGNIESIFILKDKRQRPANGGHKRLMGHAGIVFSSIIGAYSAVTEWKQKQSDNWVFVDAVDWAEGREPEYVKSMHTTTQRPVPVSREKAHMPATPNLEEMTFLRLKLAQQKKAERKKYEEELRRQEENLKTDTVEISNGQHVDEHG